MVPEDVHDQAADDRRGNQRGGKLFEEKTDLLGTDLPEMSIRVQSWWWARSNSIRCCQERAQAVHEGL